MAPTNKFGRYYKLNIELRDDVVIGTSTGGRGRVLEVILPFTIEFDVERKNFGTSNSAHFKVYNLNWNSRNAIRYDQYDVGIFRSVSLEAGYEGTKPATLFNGSISRAYSIREGTNFVTHIEAYDGGFGFARADTNQTFERDVTSSTQVIQSLIKDLTPYNISQGIIGESYRDLPALQRGNSYSGPTIPLLQELLGNGFFIDNQVAHCLTDEECFNSSTIQEIDASAGLLATPYLESNFLMIDILLEPRLRVGQKIYLNSLTSDNSITNRNYKVCGIRHKGTISGAVAGTAVTTLSCLYPPNGLSEVGTL